MHYDHVSTNYPWLPHNNNVDDDDDNASYVVPPDDYRGMPIQPLGNRQEFYDTMIKGCIDYYKDDDPEQCIVHERDRVDMSLRQPQSMRNYTTVGFEVVKAPESIYEKLRQFWETNYEQQEVEKWPVGNTYTNHWSSPSYILSVTDDRLDGGGFQFQQEIWNAAKPIIEQWTKQKLKECSVYGIRIYKEGAVLAPHVDRHPLVSSCIINVAQDVDEPWPLEVIGHDGRAHNVTLLPGEMALYESHSILHGRPFPLKGKYMANVFVHFEAIGPLDGNDDAEEEGLNDSDLPPYIIPGSPGEAHWRSEYEYQRGVGSSTFTTGSTQTVAHTAAYDGDVGALKAILKEKASLVHAVDENGWTPLHEGARRGHVDVVKILYDHGANINQRSNQGRGGTALFYAKETHGDDHPVVKFLLDVGGIDIEPEPEL